MLAVLSALLQNCVLFQTNSTSKWNQSGQNIPSLSCLSNWPENMISDQHSYYSQSKIEGIVKSRNVCIP